MTSERVDKLVEETESRLAKQDEIVKKISTAPTSLKQDVTPKVDDKSIDKNETEDSIIIMCKRDAKKFYDERKKCELSLEDQKCDFCEFATHSKGLLKLHEKEAHESKLTFSNIIYGFEMDETFFKMLVETMYEGEDHTIPSLKCEMCELTTYGEGVLKIHKKGT